MGHPARGHVQEDFFKIFILQYGFGNLIPFILLLLPRLTIKRLVVTLVLVLFGVFMMRWNVVIGGQAFSLSFDGFMHYHMPIIPHSIETFKEGLFGALTVAVTPFIIFWGVNKLIPSLEFQEAVRTSRIRTANRRPAISND